MDARIRPATAGDLPAVAAVYAHYVANSTVTFDRTPLSLAEWEGRFAGLRERGLPFLIAERQGDDGATVPVGYAYCAPWRRWPAYQHTVEDSVYVDPAALGRGVGGALLGELLRAAADAGIRQVIAVIADTGDAASMALHRRHDFVHAGRLTKVAFKHGRWLDTILMQRDLDDHAS